MHLCSKLGGVPFDISLDFGLPYFGFQRHPGWTNLLYLGKSGLLQFRLPLILILRAGNFHFIEYIFYPQPDSKVVESDVQQLSDPGRTNSF